MINFAQLPSEVLLQILSHVPIRSLLSFSLASRYSRQLADSSLQQLSLGIYTTRLASTIGRLSSSRWETCTYREDDVMRTDEYTVPVIIPDAQSVAATDLLAFHDKLASAVLSRYASGLRQLELNIWTLSPSVAGALAELRGLRSLTLRVDYPFDRRKTTRLGDSSSRAIVDTIKKHETASWDLLMSTWTWLEVLRLDGSSITEAQLQHILEANCRIRELWLRNCPNIAIEFWKYLSHEWKSASRLRCLGFVSCGRVNEEVLECIPLLSGLEVLHRPEMPPHKDRDEHLLTIRQLLSLRGCSRIDEQATRKLNAAFWHIPDLVLPDSSSYRSMRDVIEVDPDYL